MKILKERFFSRDIYPLLTIIVIGLALILINLLTGFAVDNDANLIIKNAYLLKAQGIKLSRSWGYPLYEVPVYFIIYYLKSLLVAKLYSVFWYIVGLIFCFKIFGQLKINREKAFWATLCIFTLPIFISSGNSIIDFSQGVALGIISVYFFIRAMNSDAQKYQYLMTLFCALATATRPDWVILSFCLIVTYLFLKRPRYTTWIGLGLIYILVSVLPYLLAYGSLVFIDRFTGVVDTYVLCDTFLRRTARAFLGYWGIFGIFATVPILVLLFLSVKNKTIPLYLRLITGSVLILYAVRFFLLPDKLEFVIIIPVVTLIYLASVYSVRTLQILFILCFIPNLIQIHFFERDYKTYELKPTIGISPGALYQEQRYRLLNAYYYNEIPQLEKLAKEKYGPAYTVLPRERLRYYLSNRWKGTFYSEEKRKFIVYDLPDTKVWRQFIKFTNWKRLTLDDFYIIIF